MANNLLLFLILQRRDLANVRREMKQEMREAERAGKQDRTAAMEQRNTKGRKIRAFVRSIVDENHTMRSMNLSNDITISLARMCIACSKRDVRQARFAADSLALEVIADSQNLQQQQQQQKANRPLLGRKTKSAPSNIIDTPKILSLDEKIELHEAIMNGLVSPSA